MRLRIWALGISVGCRSALLTGVLFVQIQHASVRVAGNPNHRCGAPARVHTICSWPMSRDRKRLDDEIAFRYCIDGLILPGNRAPSDGQSHHAVVMLTGWCSITQEAGGRVL